MVGSVMSCADPPYESLILPASGSAVEQTALSPKPIWGLAGSRSVLLPEEACFQWLVNVGYEGLAPHPSGVRGPLEQQSFLWDWLRPLLSLHFHSAFSLCSILLPSLSFHRSLPKQPSLKASSKPIFIPESTFQETHPVTVILLTHDPVSCVNNNPKLDSLSIVFWQTGFVLGSKPPVQQPSFMGSYKKCLMFRTLLFSWSFWGECQLTLPGDISVARVGILFPLKLRHNLYTVKCTDFKCTV